MKWLWEMYWDLMELVGLMLVGILVLAVTAALVAAPIVALWLVIESR